MRDVQRAKLYRAEREAFPYDNNSDPLPIERVRAQIHAVLLSDWVRENYPRYNKGALIEVIEWRGRWARAAWFEIKLPPWARHPGNWWVPIHETAHIITKWSHHPQDSIQAHGREFARCYLGLVGAFRGAPEHAALAAAYKKHGVKWRQRPELSDERRAELRSRGRVLAFLNGRRADPA